MSKTKLVIDAATRKKLMGFSIISGTTDFTPEIKDIDPQFLPTFKIKALSVEDQRTLKFLFIDSLEAKALPTKEKVRRDDVLSKLTQESIVGYDNLIDISTDSCVAWESEDGKDYISKKMYDSLPTMLKVHVMNHIMSANGLV